MAEAAHRFRRHFLVAAAALWLGGAANLALLAIADRQEALILVGVIGTFFAAGKVPAIAGGLAFGADPVWVATYVLLPDLAGLLFAFPFLRLGVEHLGRWSRWVQHRVEKAREQSEKKRGFVGRIGPWGIFAISVLPGGFYSPLAVAVLAQIAGLRDRWILAPIVSAMVVMVAFWTVTMHYGLDLAAAIDPRLPFAISLTLAALFIGLAAFDYVRWRRVHGKRPAS